jgi:hypothetical protein
MDSSVLQAWKHTILLIYVHGDTWGDIAGNLKSVYWDEQFYADVRLSRHGSLKGLCSLEAVSLNTILLL